jgi:N-methylhydantoinase A
VRVAVDTGGTFTDLIVAHDHGLVTVHKSPTTAADPVQGVLNVLDVAARANSVSAREFVSAIDILVYGTTVALNALLTGRTARTAFLTTRGHPDVLLMREGGREHFNVRAPYPAPYVPRSLTFELPERMGADGAVVDDLDIQATISIIKSLRAKDIEAVAVCLLWSIANPVHELRVGELLASHLPEVPYTLSHQLNPTIREYRRASSTAIDASLKPLMADHLRDVERRLRDVGVTGRLLMVTSSGGLMSIDDVARAPIHSIKSGPAMGPVAGRHYATTNVGPSTTAVIMDTGGTSFDVSLVRRGRLPWTRETWLGPRYLGHMTGFPSIDVRSYGAGGGSVAWVDSGGLLHVGPESAGAIPGPACYGRGGTRPTVTDAALVLGYIDPANFLGGTIALDRDASVRALKDHVGDRLDLTPVEAASAVMRLVTELMARAVEDTAVGQGVDVRSGALVAGGGAAGLNCVAVARRLGCSRLLIPDVAAVLSAAGALRSNLAGHYSETYRTSTARFSYEGVGQVLGRLRERADRFVEMTADLAVDAAIEYAVEGHYPSEVYDLETLIPHPSFESEREVESLRQAYHAAHNEHFAVVDPEAPVELVTWHVRVSAHLAVGTPNVTLEASPARGATSRQVFFPDYGWREVPVYQTLPDSQLVPGPAVVSSAVTTVVVDPGATLEALADGTLSIVPMAESPRSSIRSDGNTSEVDLDADAVIGIDNLWA